MIKEEAIGKLTYARQNADEELDPDWCASLDMAIKALEQEPILDKIIAEVKEWYWQADKQALAKDPLVVDAMIDLFIRTINKYKAESKLDGDSIDIDKAVEHYEGTLATLKGIDLEDNA